MCGDGSYQDIVAVGTTGVCMIGVSDAYSSKRPTTWAGGLIIGQPHVQTSHSLPAMIHDAMRGWMPDAKEPPKEPEMRCMC